MVVASGIYTACGHTSTTAASAAVKSASVCLHTHRHTQTHPTQSANTISLIPCVPHWSSSYKAGRARSRFDAPQLLALRLKLALDLSVNAPRVSASLAAIAAISLCQALYVKPRYVPLRNIIRNTCHQKHMPGHTFRFALREI